MTAISAPALVLVSGASGFVGAHVCRAFLARGYAVRGTVRSPAKGEYLQKMFDGEFPGYFTFVIVADIVAPGAFDAAVKDVDAIAHTASPFEFVADDEDPDGAAVTSNSILLKTLGVRHEQEHCIVLANKEHVRAATSCPPPVIARLLGQLASDCPDGFSSVPPTDLWSPVRSE
ncbi:hypothetical protein BKA62DRAFT_772971 [Auriculariales sp. MPI-PUGE-AT-0066]|nr:hypothetical protein BKA62DRAFT_772971 [Auriculariales sp. MPI-PUGE-AT-0066]